MKALEFVAHGQVKPMVEVFPKERVGEAYEAAGNGRVPVFTRSGAAATCSAASARPG